MAMVLDLFTTFSTSLLSNDSKKEDAVCIQITGRPNPEMAVMKTFVLYSRWCIPHILCMEVPDCRSLSYYNFFDKRQTSDAGTLLFCYTDTFSLELSASYVFILL